MFQGRGWIWEQGCRLAIGSVCVVGALFPLRAGRAGGGEIELGLKSAS